MIGPIGRACDRFDTQEFETTSVLLAVGLLLVAFAVLERRARR